MTEPNFRDTVLYKMLKSGGFLGGQIMQGIRGYNTAGRRHYIEGDPQGTAARQRALAAGLPDPGLGEHAGNPDFNENAHRGAPTSGQYFLGVMGDLRRLATAPVRGVARIPGAVVPRATSMSEDAGRRLGQVFGDMFGKLNTDKSQYGDDDIVSLLNEKEEIEVLNRETERLRRIARIQARKREKIKEMTSQALRSPYL